MICKWCGANTPDSKPKCTRCGRPLPPKSDCGGFYDIVPDAKKVIASRSNPTPTAGGTTTYIEVPGEPDKKYQIAFLSVCAALLIVLILMFVYMGKAGNLQKELDELEKRYDSNAATSEEKDKNSGEEDITPGDDFDIFKDKDIWAEIDLSKKKQKEDSAEKGENLPDKVKKTAAKTEVSQDELPKQETSVFTIPVKSEAVEGFTCEYTEGKSLVLKFKDKTCFEAAFSTKEDKQQIAVSYEESILGTAEDASLTVKIEKKSGDSWEPVDKDDNPEDPEIALNYEDKDSEYRLTVTRKNTTGGSFTVVISGITAPKTEKN